MQGFLPQHFLVYIAVDPEARGQGVGKKLLDFVKMNLSGDICLHVEADNPARRLYEREGFTNKYLEMRFHR
jgi:ribosomal protein S18 acetylase RimI-like enzyme